jgi:asparagine synthase (glutamine-hydrolysing)
MCGLIFVHDPARESGDLVRSARTAVDGLAHRGPDGHGLATGRGFVLGHRRLSIIDLRSSRQPMEDEQGRYLLGYNGEIYNYRELRSGLEGRWRFRTDGDTEVLLAGLVSEGSSFLELAEGMWAFALWDRAESTLLLARDRMGKKPLYYSCDGFRFILASELPALLRMLPDAPVEDLDSTADYLRYGYYLPGTTAYVGVKEVLPGHWLRWTPSLQLETRPYWRLRVGGFQGSREDARSQLRERLTEAVRRRLVADVDVGAFLSGGIDSSLVVALLAQNAPRPPKTFTIGFSDPAFDERGYARVVARQFGTDHQERVLEGFDQEELTRLVLSHVGQPFGDSSILPSTLVSRLASESVKVAVSGDGGDELFCGYQRYLGRALLRWYLRVPPPLRRAAEAAIRALPEPMAHHSRSLLKKAHLFVDLGARLRAETPYVAPVMYNGEDFAALAPDLVGRGHAPPSIPEECGADDIWRMMTADALVYLPQDLMVKVDRASMSCSLESRAPFLDRDLVELAFSLPRSFHMRRLRGKRMLREGFGSLLPDVVWNRRKQGFGVPIHRWFREELGADLEARLSEVHTSIQSEAVRGMLRAHRALRRDHSHRLWQIYAYCRWLQHYL